MPSFEDHCVESITLFGKAFGEVHQWLDECHDRPGYGGVAHRRLRHHQDGVLYVQHRWGIDAAKAARQHIISDLKQVGWTGVFPQNERHCIQLGLWVTR